MCEIKFRAWHKHAKRMLDVYKLSSDVVEERKNGFIYTYDRKEVVLMRFTGLLDKNGKEIYEDDIVKILYTDWMSKSKDDKRSLEEYLDSLTHMAKVVFVGAGYELVNKKGYRMPITHGTHGYIEVIGNIYDNELQEEVWYEQ